MILYHGSKDIIEKPIYGQGKKYNDYGLGFYCTDNIELAKEWGTSFERSGYVFSKGIAIKCIWRWYEKSDSFNERSD